ncbi:efflux RND transporter periplasmic adaptor subunit [Limnohabitans sp. Rim8]|uniref:efflux RND transporter periplasmic adaptor subunit n=1 Tax=Limnohabitans sp. Rim8 TaxID=1100718 RepID=UPI0025D68631|nr:efflux RND transporter periplasmic adaptor subunit [Limnohabitans sp. Rim8]
MTTLVACSKAEAPQEPLRSVKLLTVAGSDLNLASEFSAEVRARVESRLGFRVGGKLVQRPAEPGQRVAAGQLLALVDAQDFQLAAQAAQAQVSAAQSQRDLAAAEFKRFEALKAQNFISGAELERREASLKAAEAALNQAKAQAQAQGNQAGYARLTASHAGVITAVEAEVGQVVSAGQPVVRLAHDGPRDAVFAVSESAIMSIRLGQSMQAMVLSTGQMVQGTVREMAASADPVTRTYAVKLALAPGVGRALPLGATLNVRAPGLSSAVASAIKLPTSALRQEGQGTAVWVLDEATMTVNSQAVQLGPVDGNEVVVSSGLQPGQKVVSAGVHVLSPGQKVTVYGAAPTPASAPGAVPAPSATAPR